MAIQNKYAYEYRYDEEVMLTKCRFWEFTS